MTTETTKRVTLGANTTKNILMSAVRQGILQSAMSKNPFPEKVVWAIKPNFDTACWSFQSPVHKIFMGDSCLSNAKEGLTEEELIEYATAYLKHERDGHGRHTIRDFKVIDHMLRPLPGVRPTKIPFSLFNLFADARCEHLIRVADEEPLGWRKFESKATKVMPSPTGVLFRIIQAETEAEAVTDEWLEFEAKEQPERLERVMSYYLRVIACETEHEFRPLMLEWLDEFNEEQENQSREARGNGPGAPGASQPGGLELGLQLAADAAAAAEFEAGCEPLVTMPTPDQISTTVGARKHEVTSRDAGTGHLLSCQSAILDEQNIRKLGVMLKKALVGPVRSSDTDSSTESLALHNLLPGGDATLPFSSKSRRGRGKRKVGLVLDVSGSMGSANTDPMGYGRDLVAAMSDLARQGAVSGFVLLTAVTGAGAQWERFKLPMSRKEIARMQGFAGAEGIANALYSNVADLRQMHRVFLYSDGNICDDAPDKAQLRAQGVEVVGLYCGDAADAEELKDHVKRAIIRKTPMDLAIAMLQELKGI